MSAHRIELDAQDQTYGISSADASMAFLVCAHVSRRSTALGRLPTDVKKYICALATNFVKASAYRGSRDGRRCCFGAPVRRADVDKIPSSSV